MAKTPLHEHSDEPQIADAASFFQDDPSPSPGGSRSRAASSPLSPNRGRDTFEFAGDIPDDSSETPPPIPAATRAAPRPKKRDPEVRASPSVAEESAQVDEIWTRGAEWGPSLLVLGGVGASILVLFYLLSANLGLAFLILLVGGAAWVLLTYPIVITLERPVRMTPEQGLKDYYAALSHHYPHYRRMWLLLSTPAREAHSFDSLATFQTYWKEQLAALKATLPSKFTPLDFNIEDFKAEKSAGKRYVDARYTLSIYVRGQKANGPIKRFHAETGLVKGPDSMWYLNDGTLPKGER
jgi:hypothetical protein